MSANAVNAHTPAKSPQGPMVSLAQLSSGARCRIAVMQLQPADTRLLNAMGLTDHCELCVCRPGEPCIVRINCTRLGIAGSLARKILVHLIDGQD
ncbi:MAG: ferrous iron transport protein A [Planctomycetes bacterium]|nr:ferrous iron transport protein A [Planctomycetota bacterium]